MLSVTRSSASTNKIQRNLACGMAQFLKSVDVRYSRWITRQPPIDSTICKVRSWDPESAISTSFAIVDALAMH